VVQDIHQDQKDNRKMKNNLIDSIESYIKLKKIPCSRLADNDAKMLIEKLVNHHSLDLSRLYLWEDIIPKASFFYGDNSSLWEDRFYSFLQDYDNEIYLSVTDDEFYPWEIFKCEKKTIIGLLNEQQYFEFFIFDISLKQILFDTHHNELILLEKQ